MPSALVIEDDEDVRKLVVKLLESDGFTVTPAVDGLDGLMKIEQGLPDVIICDMMMPNLDGMSFTRAIKKHSDTRSVPVIFLTAKTDTRTVADGISAGAKFYLTKPFNHAELLQKVRKALGAK
ncbi:MAG: response regulator [Archangiaceae bacterium]|nr:response regulator [Archangiaceae bacterium]